MREETGSGLRTVVYHPEIGQEIAEVMRAGNAPGTIIACTTEKDMASEMEHADVLMATHCDLTAAVRGPRLRWVQSLASGVEDWLKPPGPPKCPITRMTGVYERYMAEYVMAHVLALTQELARLGAAQAAREWLTLQTTSLQGKVIGVAGLGHVGSAVASRASAFEMTVWGLRREANGRPPSRHVERVFGPGDRAEFFGGLDFLVLAMPLTRDSRGFVDAGALKALPSRAILVNISRGGLVDENAMTAALVSGEIAGAILDTFAVEPLPRESPLWGFPNVTVTPHMAGAVHASEVGAICARNLIEFASGRIPAPIVDVSRGY